MASVRTIHRDIVGAFILSNDGYILLGKSGAGGVYQDMWLCPGGGIDAGETKREALAREVMEEVSLDINGAIIKEIDLILTGESDKTLKETGETVHVEMTFNNFTINFDKPADDLPIKLTDDLGHAEWIKLSELGGREYTPSVKQILNHLGYL